MLEIGLYPSSTRQPGGKLVAQKMSHYPLKDGKFMLACDLFLAFLGEKTFPMFYSVSQGLTTMMSNSQTNPLKLPFSNFVDFERFESISNKEKYKITYICLNCITKVWGKPYLNLICGTCGYRYQNQLKVR